MAEDAKTEIEERDESGLEAELQERREAALAQVTDIDLPEALDWIEARAPAEGVG